MLRNSDDFFPDVETSHPWHVFVNAHNALFVQHLNVLPDWDMFQTSHPWSGFHAASRCLSGGPIYITDYPENHDVNLIHQMSAPNPRGQTVILRPSNVGKTVGVYDRYEERGVLKIGAYDGKAETGTGMLGVFNLAEQDISFVLPVTKIPSLSVPVGEETRERRWIIRSHMSKKITGPITPVVPFTPETLLQGKLGVRGYDIWSALPVHTLGLATGSIEMAVIGLIGKMTGACAIVDSHCSATEDGKRCKTLVQLKTLGMLGIWVNDPDHASHDDRWRTDDMMVMIQGKPIPEDKVRISDEGIDKHVHGAGARVVEIDVLGAWREMELQAGWNNEVGVEVFLS